MSQSPPKNLPWHQLPSSPSGATCNLHLLQAGGLRIPTDLALLPGPDKPNNSLNTSQDSSDKEKNDFYVPDYVFLIEHIPTKTHYIFDLGMRKDLKNLPPLLVETVLPNFPCDPLSPADILREHGTPEQQPEHVKAVIFSHMHFDHVGDGAKAGFSNAELWVGPTCCTYARPGYPVEERAAVLSENLPVDGSRKIVEAFVSDEVLEKAGDKRSGKVKKGKEEGLYEAVEFREAEWIGIGGFDRGFDVFGDGSAYLIDTPGHSAGHQMMLVRVRSGVEEEEDDFVLLAGDCYHHPALLKEPRRTARPPYSKGSMHGEPEVAVDAIWRTRSFAEKDNVWIVGAHDFSVGEAIDKDKKVLDGIIALNDWRSKGWKTPL